MLFDIFMTTEYDGDIGARTPDWLLTSVITSAPSLVTLSESVKGDDASSAAQKMKIEVK